MPRKLSPIYNEDVKDIYLQLVNNQTVRTAFVNTYNTEILKNTELALLDRDDLIDMLSAFPMGSLPTYLSHINNYIDWYHKTYLNKSFNKVSIKKIRKIRSDNDIPLEIDLVENTVSRDFLYDMCKKVKSKQLCLIDLLSFEGITGKTKLSEILNLRYTDIDFAGERVFVSDRNRYIKVSKDFLDILRRAYSETTLYIFNGKKYNASPLFSGDHIVKRSMKAYHEKANLPLESGSAYNRTAAFYREFSAELDNGKLSSELSKQSGLYFYISAIEQYTNSEITYENMIRVLRRYGYGFDKRFEALNGAKIYKELILNGKDIDLSNDLINILDDLTSEAISKEEWVEFFSVGKGAGNKVKDDFDNIDEKDELFKSPWKRKEEEQGTAGEIYVFNKLVEKFGRENVKNPNDNFGCDFVVRSPRLFLEIKTGHKGSFFITTSELIKSLYFRNEYYIVFLNLGSEEKYVHEKVLAFDSEVYRNCLKHGQLAENGISIDSLKVQLSTNRLNELEDFQTFLERCYPHKSKNIL